MNRAEVIRRVLRAAELAEPHLPAGVGFSSQWRNNGRGGFRPRGIVNHTTEDAGPIAWSTLYRILRNGHGAISGNAICNSSIRQTARVVVIASGTAWHAGSGGTQGLSGNASVWGNEYQRGQGQILTPDMLHAGRVWDWAIAEAFGIPTRRIVDHFEWSPGRKQDRRVRNGVQINANAWRNSITRPTSNRSWLEMASESDVRRLIREEMTRAGVSTSDMRKMSDSRIERAFELDDAREGRWVTYSHREWGGFKARLASLFGLSDPADVGYPVRTHRNVIEAGLTADDFKILKAFTEDKKNDQRRAGN